MPFWRREKSSIRFLSDKRAEPLPSKPDCGERSARSDTYQGHIRLKPLSFLRALGRFAYGPSGQKQEKLYEEDTGKNAGCLCLDPTAHSSPYSGAANSGTPAKAPHVQGSRL